MCVVGCDKRTVWHPSVFFDFPTDATVCGPGESKGSNNHILSDLLTLAALVRRLKSQFPTGCCPEVWKFRLDNTAKENKNHWYHCWTAVLLPSWGIVKKTTIAYSWKGHTHGAADQLFSVVGRLLRGLWQKNGGGVWTLDDIVTGWQNKIEDGEASLIDGIPDVTSFMDAVCSSQTTFRGIRFDVLGFAAQFVGKSMRSCCS